MSSRHQAMANWQVGNQRKRFLEPKRQLSSKRVKPNIFHGHAFEQNTKKASKAS